MLYCMLKRIVRCMNTLVASCRNILHEVEVVCTSQRSAFQLAMRHRCLYFLALKPGITNKPSGDELTWSHWNPRSNILSPFFSLCLCRCWLFASQVTQLDVTMKEHKSELQQKVITLEHALNQARYELSERAVEVSNMRNKSIFIFIIKRFETLAWNKFTI